jgi:hypothetical protein
MVALQGQLLAPWPVEVLRVPFYAEQEQEKKNLGSRRSLGNDNMSLH